MTLRSVSTARRAKGLRRGAQIGATPQVDHLMGACRRLFLRNYRLQVSIGAHDFEKAAAQTVLFNVDLFVRLENTTPTSDALDEVVDYDFIRHAIRARVDRGHIELQETLCDGVLTDMLAHPMVVAARVSTSKPDVYEDCETVGVEVFRVKEGETRGAPRIRR